MGPTAAAGPVPGGLARVLGRAALPPVAVPTADAGLSRPPRHPAADAPAGAVGRASSRPPVVAPEGRTAVSVADEEVALPPQPAHPSAPKTRATTTGPQAPGEPRALPTRASAAPPVAPPPTGTAPEPETRRSARPLTAPATGQGAAPRDEPARGVVAVVPEPAPAGAGPDGPAPESRPATRPQVRALEPPVPPVTREYRPAAVHLDHADIAAPPPATPPVVIGRIEVHVDPPAAQPDPFAGCRVVAAGLTARRGGGW